MTHVTATKARKNFFQLLEQVNHPGQSVRISLRDDVDVVMMSAEEYDGWIETLDIMSDSELVKDIREGMEDFAAGRYISLDDLKQKYLPTHNHDLPGSTLRKSRKAFRRTPSKKAD